MCKLTVADRFPFRAWDSGEKGRFSKVWDGSGTKQKTRRHDSPDLSARTGPMEVRHLARDGLTLPCRPTDGEWVYGPGHAVAETFEHGGLDRGILRDGPQVASLGRVLFQIVQFPGPSTMI